MRLIILFAALLLLFGCLEEQPPSQKILSFEDCVRAGYPILESYPRQCNTPDGLHFISGTDFLEVNRNTSCSRDDDCRLVDKTLGFGCCWAGRCAQLNYSEEKWIALNNEWFDGVKERNCPDEFECGPAPMCAVRDVNTNFTASCIDSQCRKVPIKAEENIPMPNITANITLPANITAGNKTQDNKTQDSGSENTNISGILFGDGAYLLVLEDISTPDYCALTSVYFAANQSEITKMKICPAEETIWVSPEGRIFRIKVLKTAGGYTYAEKWASVIIYG